MRSGFAEGNKHEELRVVKIYRKKAKLQLSILEYDDELPKEKQMEISDHEDKFRHRIMSELTILKRLEGSQMFVKLHEYFEDENNIYAVFER